jgi:hypothetical protein
MIDNVSAVHISANPVHHKRTKHIELNIHFVRERVQVGELRVLHVLRGEQYADVLTKGLPTSTFEAFYPVFVFCRLHIRPRGGVEEQC